MKAVTHSGYNPGEILRGESNWVRAMCNAQQIEDFSWRKYVMRVDGARSHLVERVAK